ncbi:hypothetical protein QBC39DRAFT_92794 [Podospora conica]|nr:hypothetical protein QBC39DRAFT_92794 [Schizothecium conicum]
MYRQLSGSFGREVWTARQGPPDGLHVALGMSRPRLTGLETNIFPGFWGDDTSGPLSSASVCLDAGNVNFGIRGVAGWSLARIVPSRRRCDVGWEKCRWLELLGDRSGSAMGSMVSSNRNNHLWFVGICAPEITMLFRPRYLWQQCRFRGERGARQTILVLRVGVAGIHGRHRRGGRQYEAGERWQCHAAWTLAGSKTLSLG